MRGQEPTTRPTTATAADGDQNPENLFDFINICSLMNFSVHMRTTNTLTLRDRIIVLDTTVEPSRSSARWCNPRAKPFGGPAIAVLFDASIAAASPSSFDACAYEGEHSGRNWNNQACSGET